MKILFFTPTIGIGGAERVTVNIANELSRRGHEIYIVTLWENEINYPLNDNITFSILPQDQNNVVNNLKEQIISIKPDVNIGVLPICSEILIEANKDLNIPLIASDHQNYHYFKSDHEKYVRTELYKLADVVTVLTKADYEYMKDKLPNMKVMYNPLTYPILTKPVKREKKILCMGRLNAWYFKGFDAIISVWGHISKRYPDWTLVIAGDDQGLGDFEKLKWLAKHYGVSKRIKFTGWVRDVDKLMQNCSIFALPSRNEGFPCVLLEAMSQGCAPIAFEVHKHINEIITDEYDGYLIPDNDLTLFVNKLCKLMREEDIRNKFSGNALESMKRFEIDKIGDEWEKLLTEVVKKGRKK